MYQPVEKLALSTLKAKDLSDLSRSAPFLVCDEKIRELLYAHVEAAGVPAAKAYPPYPRVSPNGPEIRRVRVLLLRRKNLLVAASTGFADPANNHHVAIFRLPDGRIEAEVVSLFEASRRLASGEPVVRRKRDDGSALVMSLSPGDTLRFAKGNYNPESLWRVQKIATKGQISLLDIADASPTEPSLFEPMVAGIMSRNAVKLSVDPIGRIRPAAD